VSFLTLSRISLVALTCVLISACQAPLAPQAKVSRTNALQVRSQAADYYPLAMGAQWEYRLLQKQDDGVVREKPMSIRITQVTDLGEGLVEAVTERRYEAWSPPATRVRRSAGQVVLSRLSDPVDGPSLTILKFPFETGATWPGRPFGGGNTETIAPQGDETVQVPAGTFKAMRVDHQIRYSNGATDTLSYWYAPGRGVVKMIERSTLFQGETPIRLEVTGELVKYVPGAEGQ
jgi:hypothetical protein